jgi:hypothetical protein
MWRHCRVIFPPPGTASTARTGYAALQPHDQPVQPGSDRRLTHLIKASISPGVRRPCRSGQAGCRLHPGRFIPIEKRRQAEWAACVSASSWASTRQTPITGGSGDWLAKTKSAFTSSELSRSIRMSNGFQRDGGRSNERLSPIKRQWAKRRRKSRSSWPWLKGPQTKKAWLYSSGRIRSRGNPSVKGAPRQRRPEAPSVRASPKGHRALEGRHPLRARPRS